MELALRIVGLIALSAFTILAIIMMVAFWSAKESLQNSSVYLKNMSDNIGKMRERLFVSLDELSELKGKSMITLDDLRQSSDQFRTSARKFDEKTEMVAGIIKPYEKLSNNVYNRVEKPVKEAATVVSAVSKAISVFANFLSKKPTKF
jgi:uncharacterized protein YoxC